MLTTYLIKLNSRSFCNCCEEYLYVMPNVFSAHSAVSHEATYLLEISSFSCGATATHLTPDRYLC
jgi:hypothetical protein